MTVGTSAVAGRDGEDERKGDASLSMAEKGRGGGNSYLFGDLKVPSCCPPHNLPALVWGKGGRRLGVGGGASYCSLTPFVKNSRSTFALRHRHVCTLDSGSA